MPLTISAIRKYVRCPRAYCLRYIKELVPSSREDALYFGSEIHNALEARYSGGEYKFEGLDIEKRSQAEAMMEAYDERYKDNDYEVKDVERIFKRDGFAGKVDLVLADGTVVDHKTAGKSDYISPAQSHQLILYAWMVGSIEIEFNVLVKHKIKFKIGETPWEYKARLERQKTVTPRRKGETAEEYKKRYKPEFYRTHYVLSQNEIDKTMRHLMAWRERIESDTFFPECDYCKGCEYIPLCKFGEEDKFEHKEANSELAN